MTQFTGFMQRVLGCGVLAILASAVTAQSPPAAPAGKPAAVVNGEPVLAADLDHIVEMLIKEKFKVQPPNDAQRREVRETVLGMLINDVLMRQFMQKNAPKIDTAEVDRYIADLSAQLQKQKPPKTVAEFYKETNQTEEEFRKTLTSRIQWEGYVKAQVKESDIRHYFDENKDFFDQVSVRASHIVLRLPATATDAEKKAAGDKLLGIRAEIAAGKIEFPDAAKKYSECPSAPGGGDIGYIARKGMVDESFARAAYSMKVGDLSDIVTTDYGIHIIKVTDRKPGTPSNFEKIKDEVREFYVMELSQQILTREHQSAKIEMGQ
jgi:peptidyl-prolyl cis-trans isomerase C